MFSKWFHHATNRDWGSKWSGWRWWRADSSTTKNGNGAYCHCLQHKHQYDSKAKCACIWEAMNAVFGGQQSLWCCALLTQTGINGDRSRTIGTNHNRTTSQVMRIWNMSCCSGKNPSAATRHSNNTIQHEVSGTHFSPVQTVLYIWPAMMGIG